MTIIAGVVCDDGLVVASDSQASSYRGVEVKRLDYTKTFSFELDGAFVAMTGAGDTAFIVRASEEFEDSTKNTKFNRAREVADATEAVMVSIVKRYTVNRYRESMSLRSLGHNHSRQAELPYAEPPNFGFLVGVCCGNEKCLYMVGPEGVASREDTYASTGSGSAFAEYLLNRLYTKGMSIAEGVRVAVYVIEEVKKIEPGCGGPTQVVTVTCDAIQTVPDDEVKETVKYLDRMDGVIKDSWKVIARGRAQEDQPAQKTAGASADARELPGSPRPDTEEATSAH